MKLDIALLVLGVLLCTPALAASKPSPVFDAPLAAKTIALPNTKDAPQAKLTCRFYPHFMVKEIDTGEIGAAQLSIIPSAPGQKAVCQAANVPAERILNADEWSGYFKGAKGDYVFFDAEDGVNGALGFAVYSAGDAKKLFEDSALGDLHSVVATDSGLTLRYQRSVAGPCSVPHDGAACWTKIVAATRVPATPAPDCEAGYRRAKGEMAKARCDARSDSSPACLAAALKELDAQRWDEAPSVILYEAEAVIKASQASVSPLAPALACHPSD